MFWVHICTIVFVLPGQFTFVQSSCDEGATNHTVTVQCSKSVSKIIKTAIVIKIEPHCSGWDRVWNFFTHKCTTRFRTEYHTRTETVTVPSMCDSVKCCPDYVMSVDGCIAGCQNKTFGENCSQTCSCPENALPYCDPESGNCTCNAGFTGENCTEPCSDGFYGEDCQFNCSCFGNATCNTTTGHCNCTEPGWMGIFCEQACNGTYGFNCSESCTCNENQTCDPVDGNCTCKAGHHGTNCSAECLDWTYGVDCLNNCTCNRNTTESCDKETGHCECEDGFDGQNCSFDCPMGQYGENCNQTCSCNGTRFCDNINGTCICLGKHGVNCSEDCDGTHYGPDCNRVCNCSMKSSNGSCDPVSGSCFCTAGWTGYNCSVNNDTDVQTDCNATYYGPNCSSVCNCSGGNYNGSCDPDFGSCFCNSGWTGDSCSIKETTELNTDTEAQENRDPETGMATEVLIPITAGSCVVLIITIIIIIFCLHRRRRQKCFNSQTTTQYNNASYDVASDPLVLKAIGKQEGTEEISMGKNENIANLEVEHETEETFKDTSKSSFVNKTKNFDEKSDSVKQEKQNEIHQETQECDSKSLSSVNTDDSSVHYSDVDSLKDENEVHYSDVDSSNEKDKKGQRYSFMKVDRNDSLNNLLPDHEILDEEQYDSLEHSNTIKKPVHQTNYSSFEEVQKEIIRDHLEDTDDPYDKVILKSQEKKTVKRNDYDSVDTTNKATEIENNAENNIDCTNRSTVKKSTISDLQQNTESELPKKQTADDDTVYNSLDHTGKSFRALQAPENVYHTNEILKKNSNPSPATEETDIKPETINKHNSEEKQNYFPQESEYNKLDHTGKSFKAVESPLNVYSVSNHPESGGYNWTTQLSTRKKQPITEEEFSNHENLDVNARVEAESDSEYNHLDHTGKSFRAVVQDNVYNNTEAKQKTDNNKNATPLLIEKEKSEDVDEGSYSFCEIDDADIKRNKKVMMDEETCIYENPNVPDDKMNIPDIGKTEQMTTSKVKPKSKQRQIDDYEHFDLNF